jgi:hypothetical protein
MTSLLQELVILTILMHLVADKNFPLLHLSQMVKQARREKRKKGERKKVWMIL